MINNYTRLSYAKSQYSPYAALINKNNQANIKKSRYKIFILILAKAAQRILRDTLNHMVCRTDARLKCFNTLSTLSEKNTNLTIYLCFQKIKDTIKPARMKQTIIKNMITLLQRIEKYKVKQAFTNLCLNSLRSQALTLSNIYSKKGQSFYRKVYGLVKKQKKHAFDSVHKYSKLCKSLKKIRVIAVIGDRYLKSLKQLFFLKMSRFLYHKNSKGLLHKEITDLKTQVLDMNVQLDNKTDNIVRLNDEITQLKIEQSFISNNLPQNNRTYGEYQQNRTNKSYSQKKIESHDKSVNLSRNGSFKFDADVSLGSILGNLNKSRAESSKYDDCGCGYRSRYYKYKSMNESLKNQLQIVKEELDVAKDLNEHFTNEIKDHISGESNQTQYERLKQEIKLIQEERDSLKEKVFKYQKHIGNLKAEFRIKVEEIYRTARKNV